MKNETVKKGRIERYKDKDFSRLTSLIFILLLLFIFYFSITTGANLAFGGFDKIYSGYPNERYEDLEKEFNNIIVDKRYIDMKKLSDKNIEFTEKYSKSNSYPEETWEITLEKGDIEVYSTIKRADNGTLELKSTRDTSKAGFYVNRTVTAAGIILLCLFISAIIWTIVLVIYFSIIDKLVEVERKYIARKAKSTVSKKDKS